jgi:hypothetical protein
MLKRIIRGVLASFLIIGALSIGIFSALENAWANPVPRICGSSERTVPLSEVQTLLRNRFRVKKVAQGDQLYEDLNRLSILAPNYEVGECLSRVGDGPTISLQDFNRYFKPTMIRAATKSIWLLEGLLPEIAALGIGSRIVCGQASKAALARNPSMMEQGVTSSTCCKLEFCLPAIQGSATPSAIPTY